MYLVFNEVPRSLSSYLKAVAVLSLLVSGAATANNNILKFVGECQVSLKGQAFFAVDSFALEASEGDCPNTTIEFSVPGPYGDTAYGVYVEFQRGQFGPGLRDKPYFGIYEKSGGSIENSARAFNAKPDTVLTFSHGLKDGARLYCTGRVQ